MGVCFLLSHLWDECGIIYWFFWSIWQKSEKVIACTKVSDQKSLWYVRSYCNNAYLLRSNCITCIHYKLQHPGKRQLLQLESLEWLLHDSKRMFVCYHYWFTTWFNATLVFLVLNVVALAFTATLAFFSSIMAFHMPGEDIQHHFTSMVHISSDYHFYLGLASFNCHHVGVQFFKLTTCSVFLIVIIIIVFDCLTNNAGWS